MEQLKSCSGKSLRILASRKGIKYYASYSTIDLIKMLTPLVNTSDFPIIAKRKLAPIIETKKIKNKNVYPNCKPQKAITNGVLSDLPHAPEKAE